MAGRANDRGARPAWKRTAADSQSFRGATTNPMHPSPSLAIHAPPPDLPQTAPQPAAPGQREQLLAKLDRAVELLERIAAQLAAQAARPTDDNRKLLSLAEVCGLLGKNYRTGRRMQDAGKLPPPVKVGREYRYRPAEVDAWIAAGCPSQNDWRAMLGGANQ